jgi:P27 family predicted phage terminase small subunit
LLPAPPVVELVAVFVVPDPPVTLLEDGAGIEAWRRLWTAAQSWLNPETDRKLMARLCGFYDEHEVLWTAIGERGYTVLGSQGQPVLNPLFTRLALVEASLLRLESALGFTPSDRARLGVAVITAQSGLSKLIADRIRPRDTPPPRRRGRAAPDDG